MSNPDKCSMTADLETSRDNLSERIATLEAENGRLTRERDEQREGAIGRGKFASEWRQNCEAARRRVAALERELDLVRSHLFSVAHALDIPEGESTETVAKKCVDALEVEFAETKALVSERNEWKDIAERVAHKLNASVKATDNAAIIKATILDQLDRWIEDETSRITGRAEALGRADRLTAALGHVADVLGVPREVDVGSQEARIVGAISKLKMSQIEPTDARRHFDFMRALARRLHVAFPEGERLAVIEANVLDAVDRFKSDFVELRDDHAAGRETRNRYGAFIEWLAVKLGVPLINASGELSVSEFQAKVERDLNGRGEADHKLREVIRDIATAAGVPRPGSAVEVGKAVVERIKFAATSGYVMIPVPDHMRRNEFIRLLAIKLDLNPGNSDIENDILARVTNWSCALDAIARELNVPRSVDFQNQAVAAIKVLPMQIMSGTVVMKDAEWRRQIESLAAVREEAGRYMGAITEIARALGINNEWRVMLASECVDAIGVLKGKLGQSSVNGESLAGKLVKCEVHCADRVAFLRSLANRLYVPFEPPYDVVERGIMFELDRWVAGDAERRQRAAKMLDVVVGVADALGVSATGKFEDVKVRMVEAVGKLKSTRPLNLNGPSINIPGSFVMVDASQWRAMKAENEKLKGINEAHGKASRCQPGTVILEIDEYNDLQHALKRTADALGVEADIGSVLEEIERKFGALRRLAADTRLACELLNDIAKALAISHGGTHEEFKARVLTAIEKLKADTISAKDWRKRCCNLTDDLHKIRTALGLDGHIHSAEHVLGAIQTVCENHHARKAADFLKRIGDALGVEADIDRILKQIEYAAKQRAEYAAIVENTCKALGVPSVGATSSVDVQRGILATIEKMQPRPGDFVMMTAQQHALDADRLAKLRAIAHEYDEFRDTLAGILRSPSNREAIIERVRDLDARLRRAQAAIG